MLDADEKSPVKAHEQCLQQLLPAVWHEIQCLFARKLAPFRNVPMTEAEQIESRPRAQELKAELQSTEQKFLVLIF